MVFIPEKEIRDKAIEVINAWPKDKKFTPTDIDDEMVKAGSDHCSTNWLQAYLDELVADTTTRPVNNRQLFHGIKRNKFYWIDLADYPEQVGEIDA